jgi:hypothetical protein
MNRRRFFISIAALAAAPLALARPAPAPIRPRRILLQESPLAGFQYHQGERLWPRLREGQPLTLTREPDNLHDPRAVRIDWQGHRLGYLPRTENTAVSQLLDRGERIGARIARLRETPDPWGRIGVSVELELKG